MRLGSEIRRLDAGLVALALALCALGLVLIFSATHHQGVLRHLPLRQLAWVGLGVLAMSFTYALDHQALAGRSRLLYWGTVAVLLALLLLGKRSQHGGVRWVDLRLFYFQPSDLAKLVLILTLARLLVERSGRLERFSSLLTPLAMAGLLMLLILRQPDLGTALVILPVTLAMLYVAGARPWHLGALTLAGGGSLPLLWGFLKDYQKRRILTFLDPSSDALGAGYNAIQSQIAVGSGGLWGKGYLQGTQSQLHFVPFHHTDFIFSVLAEEWGFAGSLLCLGLYLALLTKLAAIGSRSRSLSGSLVCAGLAAMLGTQLLVNVGMSMGLLPVTGLPLPMVSYGGSSTVTAMLGLGMALSIHRDNLGNRA